jgi:hypothetical protein
MNGRFHSHRITGLALATMGWLGVLSLPAQEEPAESPTVTVTWQQILEAHAANKNKEPPRVGPRVIPFMRMPDMAGRTLSGPRALPFLPGAPEEPMRDFPSSWIQGQLKRNFLALSDNSAVIPPDTIGAVGPNHVMTMLNSEVRIQTKDGDLVGDTVSLYEWWNHPPVGGDPFDPKIYYDIPAGRWIAVCDASTLPDPNSAVLFAISATSDPTGTWYYKSFDADTQGTYWADFPSVGFNKNYVAIVNNMFTVSNNEFGGAKAWVINKPNAMNGNITTAMVPDLQFDTGLYGYGFTVKPCETYDPNEEMLYVVDNFWYDVDPNDPNNPNKYLPLVRLSLFQGTPSNATWVEMGFFNVANRFSFFQIDATQRGDSHAVSTNDPRISSAVMRNGHLWFTHTAALPPPTATPNRTAAFWYEIDPATYPPSLVQSGVLDGGFGQHYYFSSIAVNSNNDACLGFSHSNPNLYVEGAWTFRAAGDSPGTMRSVKTLKSGEAPYYKTYGGSRNRWGDYSATLVDPTDDTTFWTIQEYAWSGPDGNERDLWSTWWGEIALINDCNLDEVSDECNIHCGPDCDPNTCGQSQDCDADGVPDECELCQITTQPVSATACTGSAVTFSCQATGPNTLAYQWRKNGTVIDGATASAYTIATASDGDAGSYDVVVSDFAAPCLSKTSSAATLTLQPQTVIVTQPQGQPNIVIGDGASFTVAATGPAPLTYQWRKDGQPIAGATSSTYTMSHVLATAAGQYDAVVTSACTSVTSARAELSVLLASATLRSPSDGAIEVDPNSDLKWNGVFGAATYDVYFGTANPPPLLNSTSNTDGVLSTLEFDTIYYWKIVARVAGISGEGPVWSFRTQPGPPAALAEPFPVDGTTGVGANVELSWGGGAGATVFKVLIGKDATLKDAKFEGTTPSKLWAKAGLAPGTTHYWRVIAKSDWGTTIGPVWSFTTVAEAVVPDSNAPVVTPVQPAEPNTPPASTTPTTPEDSNAALSTPSNPSALCPTTGAAMISAMLLGLLSSRPRRRP